MYQICPVNDLEDENDTFFSYIKGIYFFNKSKLIPTDITKLNTIHKCVLYLTISEVFSLTTSTALVLYLDSILEMMLSKLILASMLPLTDSSVILALEVFKTFLKGFKMPNESQGLSISRVSLTAFVIYLSRFTIKVSVVLTYSFSVITFLLPQEVKINNKIIRLY